MQAMCSPTGPESDVQEVPGRLSNPPPRPVQRRLSTADVDDICATYASGTSIDELARSHGVNRTTIITHLDYHGVPRRRVVRKMTEAAVEYLDGATLQYENTLMFQGFKFSNPNEASSCGCVAVVTGPETWAIPALASPAGGMSSQALSTRTRAARSAVCSSRPATR